ncbi:hypothetical protein L486_00893 [Kwoniella mangroviensis CBS 10435]|uniref:GATA-type domain-containing protein n=1 Tax=Kwoniella mangroviensis CBS 10435 TaxID=1331196 RepID=A0A1B9J0E2_9TREE|nr:hypothetical protein L486_00893 [Kwoniella mangroviensis CBS 10435]
MDADIQASLEAVIDSNTASASPPFTKPTPKTKPSKSIPKAPKAPRAGIVRNSAADYRRREANRLAAERSRSRTAEKYSTLNQTFALLQDENEKLRIQISQLENNNVNGDTNINTNSNDILVPDSQPQKEQEEQEGDSSRQQEQEAHSNTILAALTGITGVEFTDPHTQGEEEDNDHSWIHNIESTIDAETSGRLAELAVVATTGTGTGQDQEGHQADIESGNVNPIGSDQIGKNQSYLSNENDQSLVSSPVNNPVIALAAAINTEIESIIMEDLALTKAAIASIEKQIEALKQGQHCSSDNTEEIDKFLPASALIEDVNKLSVHSTEYAQESDTIQSKLPQLHDELVKLRDEKVNEEKKVVDLVNEVGRLDISDESEKNTLVDGMKALGGLVESLLSDAREGDLSYAIGSYSTPAIARRRRGRPPKGDISRTFYQSFLLKHPLSPKSDKTTGNDDSKGNRIRGTRKPRRSRLKESTKDDEENHSENQEVEERLRAIQATLQAQDRDQTPIESHSVAQDGEERITKEGVQDEGITSAAVDRAEAFILSQLASQSQDHDGENGNGSDNVDHQTTSFVDLLPAQEELERQVTQHQQQQQQSTQELSNSIDPALTQTHGISESVLARLKKGPTGSCDVCMRTSTTAWRKLVLGDLSLKVCNACGLYHKRFGVLRPPELWDDGNVIRRRRAGPRNSTAKDTLGEESGEGDDERPNKKAKVGGVDDDQVTEVVSNLNTDGMTSGMLDGQGDVQIPIPPTTTQQEEEDGRRAKFNAAIMEGISAINAAAEREGDENGVLLDVQMD